MNKEKTIYICESCGGEVLRWQGRCPFCGAWNTLREMKREKEALSGFSKMAQIEVLKEIKTDKYKRLKTNISEFDRVLGGGIIPGSLILLAGEPGIGKSTLLIHLLDKLSKEGPVLYVSGEESKEQIKHRAERLQIRSDSIKLLCETDINRIVSTIAELKPKIAVIDSIQTMYDQSFPSTPGSPVQVRECGLKLEMVAQKEGVPIIITSHVTKEGIVAGPKTLEHLVDVVLYLEGERFKNTRILWGTKNRFGPTEEVGVFEMEEKGFFEVKNPSKFFLEESGQEPGSAVTAILSGTRVFLVEIQSLLSKSYFGYPKRIISGFDPRRLDLLLAVLEKKIKIPLYQYDVYVNIVGGMKIEDRGVDLALCSSIFSAFKNKKIKPKTVIFGEVGLLGEVREVLQSEKRTKEAKSLGYTNVIGPKIKTLNEALSYAI